MMVTKIIAAPWGAKYKVQTFSHLIAGRPVWGAVEHKGQHRVRGYGANEAEAVSDLLEQLQKREAFDWIPPEVA